jgi:hypothetical protein
MIGTDGKLGTGAPSSSRFKTNVRPMGSASGGLMRLRPVTYQYKPPYAAGDTTTHFGLIAEEVAHVYPTLVQRGPDGRPNAVLYTEVPALLLAQIQRQQRELDAPQGVRARADRQQHQIDQLAAEVRALVHKRH